MISPDLDSLGIAFDATAQLLDLLRAKAYSRQAWLSRALTDSGLPPTSDAPAIGAVHGQLAASKRRDTPCLNSSVQ